MWSWNRNRNRNFSKVGTGTGTITFQKLEPEPYLFKSRNRNRKKIVTVPQRWHQGEDDRTGRADWEGGGEHARCHQAGRGHTAAVVGVCALAGLAASSGGARLERASGHHIGNKPQQGERLKMP
jgi:hypothetical protein